MSKRTLDQITVANLKQRSYKVKCKKVLLMLLYLVTSAGSLVSSSGIAHAQIIFKPGWNDPLNSNVQAYTVPQATTFLRNYSDELKKGIDSPSCTINVTKGCHQPNDAHFTLNGIGSKASCKSSYAGSNSVHVGPCP